MKKSLDALKKGNALARVIIKELESDDIDDKLKTLDKLNKLPELPTKDGIYEYKEYSETKDLYKRVYTLAARTIMDILNTDHMHFRHDPSSSFNYTDPVEPIKAAESIKFLPKAYMGGPVKAAVQSPYEKVYTLGVNYYDSLPRDLKYSQSFPDSIRKRIRSIKAHIH